MSGDWTPELWDRYWTDEAERRERQAREARAQIGKLSPKHVCGLQGYNPAIDEPCPGCAARLVPSATKEIK